MASVKEKLSGLISDLNKKWEAFNKPDENPAGEPPATPAAESQKFAEYPLEDGKSILVTDNDTLEKGSAVKVLNDAGEPVAMPDGEYKCKLPDGTMAAIKVEAGIVTEYAPMEMPAPETEEQAASPENNFQSELDALKAAVSELQAQVKSLAEGNTKLESENETSRAIIVNLTKENESLKKDSEKTKEILKDTFNIVQALSEAPSVEATEKPANTTIPVSKVYYDANELRKSAFNM